MSLLTQRNTGQFRFNSLTDLRALSGENLKAGEIVFLSSATPSAEGSERMYAWNATSTDADAGEVTIKLTDTDTGRLKLFGAFLQSGTGATPRTLLDKARDFVTATDFAGVDPTGATDSTAGIQAALDAHRKIRLPDGTYKVGGVTLDRDYMEIEGEGPGVTFVPTGASDTTITVNGKHCKISSLRFASTLAEPTSSATLPRAINIADDFCTVSKVYIQGYAVAVKISAGICSSISDSYILVNGGSAGIHVNGGGQHSIENNAVFAYDDNFEGSALVHVEDAPATFISKNYISRGLAPGILVDGDSSNFLHNGVNISFNNIDRLWNWGILCDGQHQVQIANNWISAGQMVDDSGTQIQTTCTGGIKVIDSKDFQIRANNIYSSQGETYGGTPVTPSPGVSHGLYLDSCVGGVVSENVAQYHSCGFASDGCSGVVFSSNVSGQISGLGAEGTPQYQGFKNVGANAQVSYVENVVYSLAGSVDPDEYKNIQVYKPAHANKVTSWTNGTFDTFAATGGHVTSAISAAGSDAASSNVFSVRVGKTYKVTALLTLNSGTAPTFLVRGGDDSAWDFTSPTLVAGLNEFMYVAQSTGELARVSLNIGATATNFAMRICIEEIGI